MAGRGRLLGGNDPFAPVRRAHAWSRGAAAVSTTSAAAVSTTSASVDTRLSQGGHAPGMANDAWALPETLRGTTFTTAEARALRVGKRRLRSERALRLLHGVWVDAHTELTFAQRCGAALATVAPDAWISHASAAQLHELPLPPQLRELDRIDVSVPAPTRAPRGGGIRGRQRDGDASGIALLGDLRVATAAQAFVDGCDYLGFEDLVALGDAIVWEGEPHAEVGTLIDAIDRHAGKRRHQLLLRAARAVHPRARSRPETINRLALRALGSPEPWCNVPVLIDDGAPISPDVAFWPARLVIEVEGDQHRTDRRQWRIDLDRYNRLQRCEVEVHRLVVTTVDAALRQLVPIMERIHQRWDASRPLPPTTPTFEGRPLLGSDPWLPLGR